MRVFLWSTIATVCFCIAVVLGISSCGDKVQSGLTGIDIQVTFESDLPIRHLRFAGFIDHAPAFPRDDRPHAGDNRDLDPTDENLIVLLPDTMGQQTVFVRVDGIDEFGSIKASSGEVRMIERDKILAVRLHLGEARICGDGVVHPTAEKCDDGNQIGDDGCSGECVVEKDWFCQGVPSDCRTCGDGECSVGEDHCSCMEDCEDIAMCGDGLCCPAKGENVCSCPGDCLEEGAQTCPDTFCCPDEREAGNCMPDCGECPNGTCEDDKGEDPCTCPEDCSEAEPICGNQNCCTASGEDIENCSRDCCPEVPVDGDGTCCLNESAETSPNDCCPTMALCGDSECCPGEDPTSCAECCPNPVCGDGVCCGDETVSDCPMDCCPNCTDASVVCPGCCTDDCPTNGSCEMTCDDGCSCYFDCDGTQGCTVNCTASSCFVECTNDKPCNVTCEDGNIGLDAGLGGGDAVPMPSNCYCIGQYCNLTCPPGRPIIDCGDGGQACGFIGCP